MFPVFHNVPRFVPDWMKTGVSVSMVLLEPCVWRVLLAMMNGADTTPAVMVTPVNHTERGDIIRALNMMVLGSGLKNKQFIHASTFYCLTGQRSQDFVPKADPGPLRDRVPPVYLGSSPRPHSGWTCPETFTRKA